MSLLDVSDLTVELSDGTQPVDSVSLGVEPGECLAIVGESGCGKTMTARAIIDLLPAGARMAGGTVVFQQRERPPMRGTEVGMVFQDPMSGLNPVLPVGWQVAESLKAHTQASRAQTRRRAHELLEHVGIPDPPTVARLYPHQLSGGMLQRVMIAMAVALRPALLIADEPTTALDVTVQAQILDLLRRISTESGMAVILITHDLGVVATMADRVLLMYAGRVAECSSVDDFYGDPMHPYGRALLGSIPRIGSDHPQLVAISGAIPRLEAMPAGCRFHPRCPLAFGLCSVAEPSLRTFGDRQVACHLADHGP